MPKTASTSAALPRLATGRSASGATGRGAERVRRRGEVRGGVDERAVEVEEDELGAHEEYGVR